MSSHDLDSWGTPEQVRALAAFHRRHARPEEATHDREHEERDDSELERERP